MQLGISEILKRADEETDKQRKIAILRENISRPMLDILLGAYDERVEWLLPRGPVPYRPAATNAAGLSESNEGMLYAQTRTLYLYTKGGGAPEGFTQSKREISFVQLLESVDPRDAELLIAMKDKKLPYPTLTPQLIAQAFPNLLFRTRDESPDTEAMDARVKEMVEAHLRQADADRRESEGSVEPANAPKKKRGGGRPKGSKNKPKEAAPQQYHQQPPPLPQQQEELIGLDPTPTNMDLLGAILSQPKET